MTAVIVGFGVGWLGTEIWQHRETAKQARAREGEVNPPETQPGTGS